MISMRGKLEKRPLRGARSNPEDGATTATTHHPSSTSAAEESTEGPPGSTNTSNSNIKTETNAQVPPQLKHEEEQDAQAKEEAEWIWKGEWIFSVAESDRTANRLAFEYTWRSRNRLSAPQSARADDNDDDDDANKKRLQTDNNTTTGLTDSGVAATSSNAGTAAAATPDTAATVNSDLLPQPPPAESATAHVSATATERQNPPPETEILVVGPQQPPLSDPSLSTKKADDGGDAARTGEDKPRSVIGVNADDDEPAEMDVEKSSSAANNIGTETSSNLASKPEKAQGAPSNKGQSTMSDTEPVNNSATSSEFRGHTLPGSGKWEGSFDTLVGRKGQQRKIIVPESFSMNWNRTPDHDLSKVSIRLEQHEPLPEHHVFVTGRGENQYGPFEFVGSLDLATFQLQCQKQYIVVVPQEPRKEELPSRIATRKRQLSWKRRYDEMDFGVATAGGEATMATTSGGDGIAATGSASNKRPRKMQAPAQPAGGGSSTNIPTTTAAATGIKKLTVTIPGGRTAIGSKGTTPRPGGASSQPSPVAMPSGPKKRPPTTSTGASTAATSSSSAGHIKLPAVGDPLKARWRAAHFLYYHDVDQLQPMASPRENGTSSTTQQQQPQSQPQPQQIQQQQIQQQQQQPKFIVYEGELLFSKREGRGVCLYNSGLIYEGDWKRDKEHGVGTLLTSDRQRVIYQGEWERGRMHGRGTYNYYYNYKKQPHSKAKSSTSTTANSRYEGEFKENLRHGMGNYVLPDGSTYEGQWREGAMCGRGVFTWPDGSIYDGEWKEGKRHGAGILRTSEGFVYDGNWTLNTMEGRGTATYPNGQQYNGLFSRGKREGRGTILFTNGAVYEGRFRDDAIDGQGTMKMSQTTAATSAPDAEGKHDFMIPLSFQSDIGHIHHKAGFTHGGH